MFVAMLMSASACCRRPNCMRELRFEQENRYDTATVPAVVAASIFGSQGGSLLSLTLLVPVVSLTGEEFAALSALTRLTGLQVCPVPVWAGLSMSHSCKGGTGCWRG